ncbi:hypothetical protein [Legionella sp. PATHC039]|uniref:hypothetical protein n=1 Tax=Legionella sp. PATHC039 TaxID=2992042 RepID=UPI0022430587|nr:hypothetical protein [Legionella sp. PATHC039]MCW8396311.1 hypothetical protein [Legionella sp. PATHC039]
MYQRQACLPGIITRDGKNQLQIMNNPNIWLNIYSKVQLNTRDYVAVTMDIYAVQLNNQEHGMVSNYASQSLKSYADDTVSPDLK